LNSFFGETAFSFFTLESWWVGDGGVESSTHGSQEVEQGGQEAEWSHNKKH
jgi:hypothetical protein